MNPALIAAALAAISAGANYMGQKKVDKATSRAMQKNQQANEQAAEEARLAAAKTESAYQDMPKKELDAGEALAQSLRSTKPVPEQMAPSYIRPGTATDAVIQSEGAARTGSKRYSDNLSDALGILRGGDQAMFDAGLTSRDNLTDIRRAGADMRGNNRVLASNLNAAQQKGQGWGTVGDLASLAAMVYAPYALSSASTAATAAPTAGDLVGTGLVGPGGTAATAGATGTVGGTASGALAQNQALMAQLPDYFRKLPVSWAKTPTPLNIPKIY